ncbi:MAG: hypothetical protein P4L99_26465 [Chthoniobacter sp.]|nr:hypothetical protein [Chthoniobacter sp.]
MRCRWGSFQIDGETCCVVSESSTLAGILRGATPNQVRLFDIPFAVDRQRRHLVTIGWKADTLRIFLDSMLLLAGVPLLISS